MPLKGVLAASDLGETGCSAWPSAGLLTPEPKIAPWPESSSRHWESGSDSQSHGSHRFHGKGFDPVRIRNKSSFIGRSGPTSRRRLILPIDRPNLGQGSVRPEDVSEMRRLSVCHIYVTELLRPHKPQPLLVCMHVLIY